MFRDSSIRGGALILSRNKTIRVPDTRSWSSKPARPARDFKTRWAILFFGEPKKDTVICNLTMATVFTAKETPLRRYNQTGEKFESTMFDAEDENDTSFWSEASPDPRSDHPHEVDSNSMSISSLPSWGQLLMSPGPTTERTSSHGSKGVHWAAHSPSAIILEESEEEAPSAVVEEEDALSSSADSLEDRVQRLLHSNSTSMIKQYQQQHEEELRTTLMLIQEENKALHLEIEHLHERQNSQKLLYEQEMEAKEDQWKAKLEQLQRSHQEDRVKVERELTRRLEEHDAVQDCYKSLQEHHADLRNDYQKLQHETHELKAEIATQRESNQKEKNEKVSFEHQQQIIQSLKEELQRKEAELGRHQSELERIRERASSEELKAASTIGQLREQVERLTETLDKTQKQQKALRNTKERKSSNPVGVQTQESALLSSGAFDSDHLTDRVVRIRDAAERVQLERHYQHEIQQLKLQHAREMQSLKDAGMSNFLAPGNTEQLRAVRMEYTRELQKVSTSL